MSAAKEAAAVVLLSEVAECKAVLGREKVGEKLLALQTHSVHLKSSFLLSVSKPGRISGNLFTPFQQ